MCLQYKPFENTAGKGEIALNEQFFLLPQCFLPVLRTSSIFIKFEIVVCKVFQYGRVVNLSFGKGLKDKMLALTKLKGFADNKFKVAKMVISVFDREGNIERG